jgi:hypothetical protein
LQASEHIHGAVLDRERHAAAAETADASDAGADAASVLSEGLPWLEGYSAAEVLVAQARAELLDAADDEVRCAATAAACAAAAGAEQRRVFAERMLDPSQRSSTYAVAPGLVHHLSPPALCARSRGRRDGRRHQCPFDLCYPMLELEAPNAAGCRRRSRVFLRALQQKGRRSLAEVRGVVALASASVQRVCHAANSTRQREVATANGASAAHASLADVVSATADNVAAKLAAALPVTLSASRRARIVAQV